MNFCFIITVCKQIALVCTVFSEVTSQTFSSIDKLLWCEVFVSLALTVSPVTHMSHDCGSDVCLVTCLHQRMRSNVTLWPRCSPASNSPDKGDVNFISKTYMDKIITIKQFLPKLIRNTWRKGFYHVLSGEAEWVGWMFTSCCFQLLFSNTFDHWCHKHPAV